MKTILRNLVESLQLSPPPPSNFSKVRQERTVLPLSSYFEHRATQLKTLLFVSFLGSLRVDAFVSICLELRCTRLVSRPSVLSLNKTEHEKDIGTGVKRYTDRRFGIKKSP